MSFGKSFVIALADVSKIGRISNRRAGHNFRCPLISPLSVDPLVNGTALILHFENVNLTEERLFLGLLEASTLKIPFSRIF
jgi:hypothetical protein